MRSVFYYGHSIDSNNRYLNFDEGAGELTAQLRIRDYSLTDFCNEVARAMTEIGTQTYACVASRITRQITISASDNFDLLITSGSFSGQSVLELVGFTGADLIGLNSYQGNIASGDEWVPQFPIQDFLDFKFTKKPSQSSVNESASGLVEVVKFGASNFMECRFDYITDRPMPISSYIESDIDGINKAILFMTYITEKKTVEFMLDRDNRNEFERCILESTSSGRDGTEFSLNHVSGLRDYHTTGNLTFRKV
jgi:hypothetical protein